MSCLGRERMFEYFSRTHGTPTALVRLNYAVEMRYGVLVDLAQKVYDGVEIDLTMGHVNVIWQGDAAALALSALADAASPPWVVNVAGPEILSVRAVCEQFGRLFGKPVRLRAAKPGRRPVEQRAGSPSPLWSAAGQRRADDALDRPLGPPRRGRRLNKPTHFENASGKF